MPVKLTTEELELIDQLVRRDRTAVSTALLAVAGIGAGEASRQAALSRIVEAASWAQAEGRSALADPNDRPARQTALGSGRHPAVA